MYTIYALKHIHNKFRFIEQQIIYFEVIKFSALIYLKMS